MSGAGFIGQILRVTSLDISSVYIASFSILLLADMSISIAARHKEVDSKNPILILNRKGLPISIFTKVIVFVIFLYAILNPMTGYNLWPIVIIAYLCLVVQMAKHLSKASAQG